MNIEEIHAGLVGGQTAIPTPFGDKPLVYADYTASGRSLAQVEDFIRDRVLPYYANTHSESSLTGRQTTHLREQARGRIRIALNCSDEDAVIFCGSGATAAINKIIDVLELRRLPTAARPVVFIGPYEHHSNELPWREAEVDLVVIGLCPSGQLDRDSLRRELIRHADRPLRIGSFSAASNVTGVRTDVDAICRLLHEHGALAFWDYAAAGPYVRCDMNIPGGAHKDAVFLSPHKFVGGPGTPGLLVAKRALFTNAVPAQPGGGTVSFVSPDGHRYLEDPEHREEGGTPAIVESIRAGLVFDIQQRVGVELIERREEAMVREAISRWSVNPKIRILGNPDAARLSIVSMQIAHQDKVLHYGFVVALLNDLFGIQARGGCSCAGPYGHTLLGMSREYSAALQAEVERGDVLLRPGWLRLNFNYFIPRAEFEYLLAAVELVAEHGWRLLPYYAYDRVRGVWRYQGRELPLPVSLDDFGKEPGSIVKAPRLDLALDDARRELTGGGREAARHSIRLSEQAEALRWFVLPQDVAANQAV